MAPSPAPEASLQPGSLQDYVKDLSPEAEAASFHPTPSPYQDSNADPFQLVKVEKRYILHAYAFIADTLIS